MAEEGSDPEDKSQAASPRRLAQAFDEGQVPLGRDVVSLASWGGAMAALIFLAARLRTQLVDALATTLAQAYSTPFGSLTAVLLGPILTVAAIAGLAFVGAALATVSQTQGGFWPHLAAPDLSRLFQPSRLTRLFKLEFVIDLSLALAKCAAVGATAYYSLRTEVERLPRLLYVHDPLPLDAMYAPLTHAALNGIAVLALLAGGELGLQRYRFLKKHRMTKEEAKRENKQDEGDPLIRGRRKRKHRELSKARVRAEVPRADALLVNPTHVAIAIRYRRDESAAPRVIAKGKGKLAEIMREIARENGIPIVQDIPLARLLYKKVKVGRQVPADTYKAVAAVLAVVYRLVGRR